MRFFEFVIDFKTFHSGVFYEVNNNYSSLSNRRRKEAIFNVLFYFNIVYNLKLYSLKKR